jgi:hypothetical protein
MLMNNLIYTPKSSRILLDFGKYERAPDIYVPKSSKLMTTLHWKKNVKSTKSIVYPYYSHTISIVYPYYSHTISISIVYPYYSHT